MSRRFALATILLLAGFASAAAPEGVSMKDVTAETGIEFRHTFGDRNFSKILSDRCVRKSRTGSTVNLCLPAWCYRGPLTTPEALPVWHRSKRPLLSRRRCEHGHCGLLKPHQDAL